MKIFVDIALYLAYFAIGMAILGVIGFTLMQMFQDLKKAQKTLIGIGIAVLVFVICFLFAENYSLVADADGYISVRDKLVGSMVMRLTEAGIYMFYVLLAGAGLAIAFSKVIRYK